MAGFQKLLASSRFRNRLIALLLLMLISLPAGSVHTFAQEINPEAEVLFTNGINSKRLENKIRFFTRAVDLQPDYDAAIYNLGICYFRTGKFQKCIDLLSRFSDRYSSYYNDTKLYLRNALTFRAEEHIREENFEAAIYAARQALYFDENYPLALTIQGTAYFHLRDWQAAIRVLSRSVEIDANQEAAFNILGDIYMRIEDYSAAQKFYQKVLQINPENRKARFHQKISKKRNRPEAWLRKFKEVIAKKDTNRGIEVLEQAIGVHPSNKKIAALLQKIRSARDYDGAVRAMANADWLLAYVLLRGLDRNFMDRDSLMLQVKVKLHPDSTTDFFIPDTNKEPAQVLNNFAPATDSLKIVAGSGISSIAKPDISPTTTPDSTDNEQVFADHDNESALIGSAIIDSVSTAEGFHMAPQPGIVNPKPAPPTSPEVSIATQSGLGLNRTLILACAGGFIFLCLLIFQFKRTKKNVASNPRLLETTLEEKSAPDQAAMKPTIKSNKSDGDTFYNKIASETPIVFDKINPDDDSQIYFQETRTIIGGIEKPAKIGRYLVEKEIGRGSMGLVYKAWDPKLDRTVVIKQVMFAGSRAIDSTRLKARLYREARVAGKLNHPNIIIIFDVEHENECSYIVMEYLDGKDLREVLDEEELPLRRVLDIVVEVCKAVGFAHQHGIVHRDIKPSNIIISDDKVKVADFGIAKLAQFSTLTLTGDIIGTPYYMSPEQIEGSKVDGRSDIFSTGVLLYEMLAGCKPFDGDNVPTIVYKIVHQTPKLLSQHNKELPDGIDEIIARALAKDVSARYATADEFREALISFREEFTNA